MRRPSCLFALSCALAVVGPRSTGAGEPPSKGGGARAADGDGVAAFARHPRFVDAKISPKGTYVALVALEHGRRTLVFLDIKTRRLASALKPDSGLMVGNVLWASDEHVVTDVVAQDGDLARPVSRGQLYSADATGRGGRLVFGSLPGRPQAAFVVSALRRDPRHVLIETVSGREFGDRMMPLYKLDVLTGGMQRVAQAPVPRPRYLTDENGEARIASGEDEQVKLKFFYRDPDAGWLPLDRMNGFTSHSIPMSFASGTRTVYVAEPDRHGFGLYAVNVDTGERKLLAANDKVPPRSLVVDPATGRAIAVEFEPDLPTYEFLDPGHPLCRVLRGLLAAYADEHVRLLNTTEEGAKAVVRVYSDRDPGRFLLVDVKTMSAEPLVDVLPGFRADAMSEMSAFHISASDGFRIHGYFTLPRAASPGTPSPLVVLPHGGPHQVRDHWRYEPDVQLLARNGFAVLQVNYRGSGGYGVAYREAGYRKWGGRVVEDIVDATRWAVQKGYADPKRICIFGGSFGGYAAMQASIAAPDLFRCAVGYAGVYDLGELSSGPGMVESRLGRGFVRTAVGDDEAALRAASPVYHADRIRAKVLLVHGKKDQIAPVEHAERLRQALVDAGNPPEWLLEPKEGHGFYDEGARRRLYARVLAFLKENTSATSAAAQTGGAGSAPP